METVAVIGPVAIDRVVQDGVSVYKRGGVVTYAGLTYVELGIATSAVTNIASADREILTLLRQRGIEVYAGDSLQTTHFVNYIAGDERRQELLACATPIVATQFEEVINEVKHVHLGPLYPDDIALAALAGIGAKCRVSLDIQGYVRRLAGKEVVPEVARELLQVLRCADVVKASAEELQLVLAYCDRLLSQLMADCGITEWIVTDGSCGGWVVDETGRQTDFAAHPITAVADPTGAGDVFFAAYLVSRLHRGEDCGDATRFAAELAGRQVAGDFIDASSLRLDWRA
jgi:sugar/nucleoside kinase (ribokinase family)